MEQAKKFIENDTMTKLGVIVSVLAGSDASMRRQQALHLVKNVATLTNITFRRNSTVEAETKTFAKRVALLSETIDRLSQNGNTRAQLLNLAVNF
jgi:two-component sensor histidine kinase